MLIANHNPANPTMTSRDIADLVESRHDKVKQSIDRLVARGVIAQPPMGDGEKAANGTIEQIYLIGKRDSYIIVAQLSPEFTARLVDRWQELEVAAVPILPDFTSPAAAARAWADQVDAREWLRLELNAAAPAVEFVERYVDSTGLKGFRQTAKLIGANESVFRTFLDDSQIMYKLGGEWVPYAQHLAAGRFVVKAGTSDISGHAFNSAKFTPKGVQWVAGQFAQYLLAEKQVAE